jgi:hypothetical protein
MQASGGPRAHTIAHHPAAPSIKFKRQGSPHSSTHNKFNRGKHAQNSDHRAHPSSSGGNYQGRRDDRDKRERPPSSGGRSDQGNRERRPFGNGRPNPNLNPNPNYGNNSNPYNSGGHDNRSSRPPAPNPRASFAELAQPSYHKSYHPLYNGRALTWQEFYNLTNDGTKVACLNCLTTEHTPTQCPKRGNR